MIDARIPLGIQQVDGVGMFRNAQQMRLADMMMQQQQEEAAMRREEFDFRKAVHQAGLDKAQREEARAQLGELTVDARAAMDNPALLPTLQQKWAARGLDLSGVTPETIPQHLMKLDLYGKYLSEEPEMDIRTIEPGGSLVRVGRDGKPEVLVQPNDGSAAFGAPASSGPPAGAVEALRRGEGTPEQFDAIFGPGAAARALGGGGSGNAASGFQVGP